VRYRDDGAGIKPVTGNRPVPVLITDRILSRDSSCPSLCDKFLGFRTYRHQTRTRPKHPSDAMNGGSTGTR
jgi:hypothetical protein